MKRVHRPRIECHEEFNHTSSRRNVMRVLSSVIYDSGGDMLDGRRLKLGRLAPRLLLPVAGAHVILGLKIADINR
jgi:hypothetical protein